MKKIVYYISEYGYGHAARSIAIIRELLIQDMNNHIQIVHKYAVDFLKSSLPEERITFYRLSTDIGYFLKEGSIEPNRSKQIQEIEMYIRNTKELICSEINRLKYESVDLVISDISPIAFEVADRLGIPSVGISNFTWYTAFQELVPSEILAPLKGLYKKMDYYFALAGSNEEEWGRKEAQRFGFHARRIDPIEVNRIKAEIPNGKHLVFIGLGMKMELKDLQSLHIWNSPNTHFLVSSNLNIEHPSVSHIPIDYLETQNYIAACNLVITKAGWGTVSEAVVGRTPLLIIDRQGMKEDKNTITFLKKNGLCKLITWDQLKDMVLTKELIDGMNKSYTGVRSLKTNDVGKITKSIIRILEGNNECVTGN